MITEMCSNLRKAPDGRGLMEPRGVGHCMNINLRVPGTKYMAGLVGSIIYADLYGSIKIRLTLLIPVRIYKDL